MTMRTGTAAAARDADEGSLMWPAHGDSQDDGTDVEKPVKEGQDLGVQKQRQSRQLLLLIVQLCCMAAVGGYCLYATRAEPVATGFFCDDDSIRFPVLRQTVPAAEAWVITLVGPLFFLLLVDWLASREFGDRFVCGTSVDIGCCRVPPLLRAYYKSIGGFLFAMLCSSAVTLTGKICVGRLRPHFIDACRPDWSHIRCSDNTGFLYVDHFECTSGNAEAIREARVSFPSGHSSSAMCAMVYLALYLQSRLVWLSQAAASARDLRPSPVPSSTKCTRALWRTLKGLCPFLQLLAFAVAFFVGISRIRDRYHHPTDVLAGFCVGFLAALYAGFYIAGFGSWREAAEYAAQKEEMDLEV
ncbi:UNVERIFIED_CONTAM: hypothetical protein H355_013935 [Colinus virginianus]|nr:hypothetical protein H355_013935 [Colinus virginianus]